MSLEYEVFYRNERGVGTKDPIWYPEAIVELKPIMKGVWFFCIDVGVSIGRCNIIPDSTEIEVLREGKFPSAKNLFIPPKQDGPICSLSFLFDIEVFEPEARRGTIYIYFSIIEEHFIFGSWEYEAYHGIIYTNDGRDLLRGRL